MNKKNSILYDCAACAKCSQWNELNELCTIKENFDYDYAPAEFADYPCGLVILSDEMEEAEERYAAKFEE